MKAPVTFYHAGCPVCVSAETSVVRLVDPTRFELRVVHLGEQPGRLAEAEAAGVKSVPALVANGDVLHLNFGAPLSALKQA